MRNIDRLRTLEDQNELLRRQVQTLRSRLALIEDGSAQMRDAVDAIIIGLAIRYGEKREENGALYGYRLVTGHVDVRDMLSRWTMNVQDQGQDRVIGVFPREETHERT